MMRSSIFHFLFFISTIAFSTLVSCPKKPVIDNSFNQIDSLFIELTAGWAKGNRHR